MPAPTSALVRKFIPNNPKLAEAVTKICDSEYKVHFLPQELVRMMATRAMEMHNVQEMEIDSRIFNDKLQEFARNLKPRFMNKINEMRRAGVKTR